MSTPFALSASVMRLYLGAKNSANIFGDIRGTSKVGKPERIAKEEARYMVDAGQICVAEKVDRNYGMTYGAEKFWRVYEILKSEARRHKTEAEEEEKLLSDLLNLLERPKSKTG